MNNISDSRSWLAEVKKRLKKFLRNSALELKPIFTSVDVVLFEVNSGPEDVFYHIRYEPELDPKEFIHKIFLMLIPHYPKVTITSKVEHNPQDFGNLLDYVQALEEESSVEKDYIITKIIPQENIFILTDLDRNYKFKSNIPIFLMADKLLSKKLSREELDVYFSKNCKLTEVLNKIQL